MSMIKDWDTPFGPSSLFEKSKDMTRQEALEIQKAQDDLEWDSFRREGEIVILGGYKNKQPADFNRFRSIKKKVSSKYKKHQK